MWFERERAKCEAVLPVAYATKGKTRSHVDGERARQSLRSQIFNKIILNFYTDKMKVDKIININNPRKTLVQSQSIIPQRLIDMYGINMETMAGYKGEKTFEPAPLNVEEKLAKFLNSLHVDWRTHISRKPKSNM